MADGEVKITIGADDSELKNKLDETEEGLQGLGDKQKETQKETEKTKSKFEELAETIDKQTKELGELKGEYTQAIINFGKGSAEVKALEDKMASLNSELSKNKETFAKASNEAGKLSTSLDENEKSFSSADVAVGTFVADALTNLKGNLIETVGNIAALADETREYREDMGKLDAAFTTAGHSTEAAQKAYDGFYKILGESDRSVEAVNHLAELTKNEEELAQWSTIAAGVTAKFGDSLPIEGLTEAANETAKVGQVTGPLADALNWAGISEDAFNEKLAACNSEQERASLITSTLNGEYAAAAEEYNKLTANTQAARDATNNMEQAQAALGAAIEPVTTAWTNMKANALQWFVDEGLPALQTGWQWIQDNLPAIAVIVGGLTAAWLAFGGAQTIVTAITTAYTAVQKTLTAVMGASTLPITLIILAVTALVAGFMLLWNNCEGFREFWIDLWEKIKEAAAAIAEWFKDAWNTTINWLKGAVAKIKDFFAAAWEGIKKAFSAVGSFFSGVWDAIKGAFSAVGGWFSQKFTEAKEKIFSAFSNIKEKFAEIWTKIKTAFKTGDFLQVGKDLLKGLWNGIKDTVGWLKDKVKGVVDKIKGWFTGKDGFDEHSPSKWSEQVAVYVNEGLAKGFEVSTDKPVKAVHGVFDKLNKAIEEEQKKNVKTVADNNAEMAEEINNHNWEREKLDKDLSANLLEIDEKYAEKKKQKNADLVKLEKEKQKEILKINTDYDLAVEKENERHAAAVEKIQDDTNKIITDKMQEIVSLGNTYQDNVDKIWEDLDKSITDLQANYDNQLASRTASIASSLNLWNAAAKNKVSWHVLQNNLSSQVKMLDDYNKAIATLEERNVSTAFINSLKEMGVGATGEIETLAKMTDKQLTTYVELWEKKNALAKEAAIEELEPLKAETEAKIAEVTTAALDKYAELRAKYQEQGALLMADLKQAMLDAGGGGYEELVAQIDDYMLVGEDLLGGVIAGIQGKTPELIAAVTTAMNQSIGAAQTALDSHSPSRKFASLGETAPQGLGVGWEKAMPDVERQITGDISGTIARIQTAVNLENARMAQGVGVRDTGFTEVAQAVGMQTAGINSLASEYRRGTNKQITIPLILDKRELGRAFVEVGGEEITRTGTDLSFA